MAEGFQVIARRWRPQQFDEIVGQEHIVRTLKNAIQTGRIGHAYLFVGPRGTGKTTTARIFAKALNCVNGPSVSPSEDDPNCRAIVDGSCPDVTEIDAATNRSVEDAKQIREQCLYPPMQCRYKIYIIDEVHQLSKDAFNALLKVIEEPPEYVKFIFATTEAEKVLPTIVSRCQRFEFQPIPEEKIAARLRQITESDGVEADHDALIAIARLANGGMRDSQSILDQVISFCGKKITERDVAGIYGLASKSEIEALTAAMARADYAGVIASADKFVSEGRDLLRALSLTQARIREAMLASIRGNGKTEMLGTAMRTEQLLRMLDALNAGESGVKFGLSERANFEVTLLKAVEQSRTRAIDSLIKEISALASDVPVAGAEKKNELTAKFGAAVAEVNESEARRFRAVPAAKPGNPAASAVPAAAVSVAPASAASSEKFAQTDVSAPAAPLSKKSVAPAVSERIARPRGAAPRASIAPVKIVSSAAKRPSAKALAAAVGRVPEALRKAIEEEFHAEFSELVPAEGTRIFSAHGEQLFTEKIEPSADADGSGEDDEFDSDGDD